MLLQNTRSFSTDAVPALARSAACLRPKLAAPQRRHLGAEPHRAVDRHRARLQQDGPVAEVVEGASQGVEEPWQMRWRPAGEHAHDRPSYVG